MYTLKCVIPIILIIIIKKVEEKFTTRSPNLASEVTKKWSKGVKQQCLNNVTKLSLTLNTKLACWEKPS